LIFTVVVMMLVVVVATTTHPLVVLSVSHDSPVCYLSLGG
jgi:hypothetical protein